MNNTHTHTYSYKQIKVKYIHKMNNILKHTYNYSYIIHTQNAHVHTHYLFIQTNKNQLYA